MVRERPAPLLTISSCGQVAVEENKDSNIKHSAKWLKRGLNSESVAWSQVIMLRVAIETVSPIASTVQGRNVVSGGDWVIVTVNQRLALLQHSLGGGNLGAVAIGHSVLLCSLVIVTGVAGINISVQTCSVSGILLHDLLVAPESGVHLFLADVVQEYALAYGRTWHGGAKKSISGHENRRGGLLEHVLVEELVVHAEASTGEEIQEAAVLLVAKNATRVCQSGRERHVDAGCMPVAKWFLRNELMKWRPSVAISNDTIETDLMKIRSLKLEHDMDSILIDLVGCLNQLLVRSV